ncbi:MAG: phosphodiester glycosidase family protein, partial [Eubacteriales bacterium]|nr:phosphodiester glycosidase family protein [Eubacteriales bacterium]MDD4583830.1 phosphodiester glycosidase family protein [Eubacteriales bacterium]
MRKEIIKKGIAILLSLVMIAGPMGGLTVFGASLGDNLYSKSLLFGEKTVLANGVYWNSNANDKITENYIEYKPGGPVLPIISHGNDIYGAASFRAVVAKAKMEGKHVIGGINGDFFDMSTGVPLGMTIKDGILLTTENSLHPSVGFYSDGSAIIGRAELNIRLDGPALGTGIAHLHLNKVVTKVSGLMVYTTVFGDDNTNKATIPTYNLLLDINSGEPRINGTVEATVSEIIEATGAVQIPQGKILLTMAAETVYPGTLSKLKTLQAGDEVTLSFPANQSWEQVVYGIGGGNRLVAGGVNVAPKGSEVNPHTAMGIKADGSIIFYTVDGRQSGHSKGTTLSQLAERMIELRCIDAINLDGGGSTALHSIFPGDSTLTTVNSPSQTTLRNCANYILLINTAPATERLGHIHLYPYDLQMLAGATQKFTVKATDENYYPIEAPTDLTYSTSGKIGSFDDNGVFTAGTTAGTGEVIANHSSQVSGTAKISVVSKPDNISITNQKDGQALTGISIKGGDSIALSGRAVYRKMPLVAQSQCFNWTVEGGIGTIDKNGNFTAVNVTDGNGRIIASAGGTTASIAVNVISEGEQVETFEGTSHVLQSQPKAGLSVDLNKDLTKVRYGYQSAEIKYDFKAGGTNKISIPSAITFTKSPSTLNFWVYGDGSGNTLKLNVATPEGTKEIIGTLLDFTGWKLVVAKLPEGITAVSGLELTATGNNTGTIYLDQIICGFGHYVDQQPPAIQMSLNGRALTATIKDAIDNGLSSADIKLTYDGKPITFSYN